MVQVRRMLIQLTATQVSHKSQWPRTQLGSNRFHTCFISHASIVLRQSLTLPFSTHKDKHPTQPLHECPAAYYYEPAKLPAYLHPIPTSQISIKHQPNSPSMPCRLGIVHPCA